MAAAIQSLRDQGYALDAPYGSMHFSGDQAVQAYTRDPPYGGQCPKGRLCLGALVAAIRLLLQAKH